MASATPSATPLPPLAVISKINQSGLIAVITALALCFVLVSLIIRIHVRYSHGPWKTDDNVAAAATIVSFAQSALVFFGISKGLGKTEFIVNPEKNPSLQKVYYASNILYILVLFLSKASICLLYLRLTPGRLHFWTIRSIFGVSATWALVSIMLLTVQCSWRGQCSNLFGRWIGIGVIDCVTELALVLFSVDLVRGLQMAMSQKRIVIGAFATRLLVIPACALRLYYLRPNSPSTNQTLALSLAIICTQLQLGYGVMAASIPCLKPFITVYEKPAGGSTAASYCTATSAISSGGKKNTNNITGSSSSHSINLKSFNAFNAFTPVRRQQAQRSDSQAGIKGPPTSTVSHFRPDAQDTYAATISVPKRENSRSSRISRNRYGDSNGAGDDAISVQTHDSRRMIIETQTDWSVQYQHETGSLGDARSDEGIHAA